MTGLFFFCFSFSFCVFFALTCSFRDITFTLMVSSSFFFYAGTTVSRLNRNACVARRKCNQKKKKKDKDKVNCTLPRCLTITKEIT